MKTSLRWIIVLIWLLLIAYFSNQPFQKQDLGPTISSYPQIIHLVQQMPQIQFYYHHSEINSHANTVQFIQFIIRKIIHITVYGLFGLLLLFALSVNRKARLKNWSLAAMLVVLTATLDEMNQYLSTTRTGCVEDIALDFFGFLLFSCIIISKKSKTT